MGQGWIRHFTPQRRRGTLPNIIGYPQREELPELDLEDRKLHILCSVLALAASELASTLTEREHAFYFCSRDLRVLGSGMGGFDLGELPWSEDVHADQLFLISTCNAARKGLGWGKLSYHPDQSWLLPALEFFGQLVGQFQTDHVDNPDPTLKELRPEEVQRCPLHGVYLHRFGCLLC